MTTTPAPVPEDMSELYDANIDRVDLVGAAANGHKFILAKSQQGLVTPETIRNLLKESAAMAENTDAPEAGDVVKNTEELDHSAWLMAEMQKGAEANAKRVAAQEAAEAEFSKGQVEPGQPIEETADVVKDAEEPAAPAAEVTKADSMLAVFDRAGNLIGVIQPDALTPVDGGDAPDTDGDGTEADVEQEAAAAVNPTEADGSSAIDGADYGTDSRTIPGTNTVQSPVEKTEQPSKKGKKKNLVKTANIAEMLKEALTPIAEQLAKQAELAATVEALQEQVRKYGSSTDTRALPSFNGATGANAGIAPRDGSTSDALEPLRKALADAETTGNQAAIKKAKTELAAQSILERFSGR